MSIFDPDIDAPGFEGGVGDVKAKREAEAKAVAEVQPFEIEKRLVNFHVAINERIHDGASSRRQPIEIDSRKA